MGIAVSELLTLEYFKDFQVIAGHRGLTKEIQGVTCLDAPDGYKWGRGKELCVSSGYIMAQDLDCVRQGFREGWFQIMSGMMVKRGRYLDVIPSDVLHLFDQHDIPLIIMPYEIPWMELMSQINTAVMNRTLRRFSIQKTNILQSSNQTYKAQKIRKILQAVEVEMNFPAFLYDIKEETSYYSSVNFRRITTSFGLKESDYWSPSLPCSKHTLCDYIDMVRYRLANPANVDRPRVSWIRIPIVMNNDVLAYFVVMESREFIDYYDEYAIRIAFLLLQAVYEQLEVARNVGNIGFENFIHFALNYTEKDKSQLAYQANIQGISMSRTFLYAVFRQRNIELSTYAERSTLLKIFSDVAATRQDKLVLLNENEGALFLDAVGSEREDRLAATQLLDTFRQRVAELCPGMELEFGLCSEGKPLSEMGKCIEKCRSLLKMGKLLYPQRHIWDQDMLGPFVWLQIPEDELENMLKDYRELAADKRNAELLSTLKVYLENNMNYSLTAEKMYVHINTIRKRIDRIDSLLHINWDQHMERLKIEMLLQFLEL